MKAIQKLSMFLGGKAKKRQQAEEALTGMGSLAGDQLGSLPAGSLTEVLSWLESHGYPPLTCEKAAPQGGTGTPAPHTVKVQLPSRTNTERRTRGGPIRECFYITRLTANSWTWYAEASHESTLGRNRT